MDMQIEKVENDLAFANDPWDRLPNEPPLSHDIFRTYMYLGPERTVSEGYRQYLIKNKDLTPAEPCPSIPREIISESKRWSWQARAIEYDRRNWEQEHALMEEARLQALQEMIKRHIEGYQIIQQSAIQAFFEVDEEGQIIYDQFDRPKIRPIEDVNAALRAYKNATAGERTARGLPAEFIAMSNAELQERYVQISKRLQEADVIDGEYEELEDGE